MQYFNHESLLNQNPPKVIDVYPLDADGQPSLFAGYKSMLDVLICLETFPDRLDDIEHALCLEWAYGVNFYDFQATEHIYGVTLLKQLLIFLKSKKLNIHTFINELRKFVDEHTVTREVIFEGRKISITEKDNILDLKDFTFHGQQVFEPEVSVDIIVERALTLAEKQKYLFDNAVSPQNQNSSQSRIGDFLDSCINCLCRHLANIETEQKTKLYNQKYKGLLEAFIQAGFIGQQYRFGILENAVACNKDLIERAAVSPFIDYPFYLNPRHLNMWLEYAYENKDDNIRQQIAKIAIDILEDMSNQPACIETHEGKGVEGLTIATLAPLLGSNEILDNDYRERLQDTLIKFASYDFIKFNFQVIAMVKAYDVLGYIVPSSHELVQGIKENKLKFLSYAEPKLFSYDVFFKLSDILDCFSRHFYVSEVIDYLVSHHAEFSKSIDKTKKIFEGFCQFLTVHCQEPSEFTLEPALDMILSYPISTAQKIKLSDIISTGRESLENAYWKGELNRPLITLQTAILADNPPSIDGNITNYQDKSLDVWSRMTLYMRTKGISNQDLIELYAECELFKVAESVIYKLNYPADSFANDVMYEYMSKTDNERYYHAEYMQDYPAEFDDKNLLLDFFKFLNINVKIKEATQYELLDWEEDFDIAFANQKQLEEDIKTNSTNIALDNLYEQESLKASETGFYSFVYDDIEYYFHSHEVDDLRYISKCVNQFLEHINHSRRLCVFDPDNGDGDIFVAINLDKFAKLEKELQAPLECMTFH